VSAPQKKAAVGHLVAKGKCSQRQACRFVGLSRSTARYSARLKEDEAPLVERLQQFAQKRRRRGYRLAHQELRRSGMLINHKRVYRLWKGAGLSVPPRRSRKRMRGVANPRAVTAQRVNQVWCLDFLEERTLSGQRLRVLCISDEFTRESLAIEVGRSLRSESVCAVLEKVIGQRGVPGALRMDNGPELVALTLRGLCRRYGIDGCYIEPGKPWQNGFAESFHARLRDEYLEGEVFLSAWEAQVRLDAWRRDWNEARLHSSLGYLTPCEFAAQWHQQQRNQDVEIAETTAMAKAATGS
jgi:transposase InsO family protein